MTAHRVGGSVTMEQMTLTATSPANASSVASGANVNFTCTCTPPDGWVFSGIQRVGRGGGAGLVLLGYDTSDSGGTCILSFRNMGTSAIAAGAATATCEFHFVRAVLS